MNNNSDKIAALRRLPEQLSHAITDLDEQDLDLPWREGGWSVRQIIHHLADSHLNAFVRIKLILTENHPTLKTFDQDLWARMDDYQRDISPSLSILSGVQARMANVLERASEADLARTAHHPDNGTMTLQSILDSYSEHGLHHVEQITGLRKKIGR